MKTATREDLRNRAMNELLKKHPVAFDIFEDGGEALAEEFIKAKLQNFPSLCQEARKVNHLKQKELYDQGNPKGWSESKNFKLDYTIPKELYMFMVNMVYRNFWDEENEKVWRSFMKGVIRGDDSMNLLRKVKVYYGAVSKH